MIPILTAIGTYFHALDLAVQFVLFCFIPIVTGIELIELVGTSTCRSVALFSTCNRARYYRLIVYLMMNLI